MTKGKNQKLLWAKGIERETVSTGKRRAKDIGLPLEELEAQARPQNRYERRFFKKMEQKKGK